MSIDPVFLQGAQNQSMPQATVIPVLQYPDVRAAAEWLCRAFGFAERLRMGSHRVQLSVGQAAIVLAHADLGLPQRETRHSVMVRVADVDSHCARARQAGAEMLSPPQSHPYGERQYSAKDLAGQVWTFSQSQADVEPHAWGGVLVR